MSDVSRLLSRLPPGARQRLLRQVAGGKLAALSGATRGETDRRDPQPPQTADVSQWQEMRELRRVLDLAPSNGIDIPYFRRIDGLAGPQVEIDGRHCLNFASYDYLGLNGHPRIREAVIEAVDRYGTTVSGSRMVAGERALHGELETELAAVYGCEAALTFVSGHATGVSVLSSLFGPHDLICHDALAHFLRFEEAAVAENLVEFHLLLVEEDIQTELQGSQRREEMHAHEVRQGEAALRGADKEGTALFHVGDVLA